MHWQAEKGSSLSVMFRIQANNEYKKHRIPACRQAHEEKMQIIIPGSVHNILSTKIHHGRTPGGQNR